MALARSLRIATGAASRLSVAFGRESTYSGLQSSTQPQSTLVSSSHASVREPTNLLASALRQALPQLSLSNPVLFIHLQHYSKRKRKWHGSPYAWINVTPGQPVPPSSPNEGSVKNRNQKKRMAQKDAFIKEQAQKRKKQTKAAIAARDALRRKRWKEGAARARAWARKLQELPNSSLVPA